MRSSVRLVASLVALACLAGAATALAEDADVLAAWNSTKERFEDQQRVETRAAKRLARRGFKRPAPFLRTLDRLQDTIDLTRERVRDEEPSTDSGTSAKDYVLLSLSSYERAYRLTRRGTRQVVAGQERGFRTFTAAGRHLKRAERRARTARRLFEDARSEPPLEPAS